VNVPKDSQAIADKLKRIRSGKPIRTLDLFSGCGGIALGFHTAGFQTIGSVEFDAHAARSFALNFLQGTEAAFEALASPRDITQVDPEDALREMGILDRVDQAVDVMVGGPPCQAFARVGRAKLREVVDHPEAFRQDPRGNLYLRYIAYVKAMKPLAILMENVPDVLNYGGHNISNEICECLEAEGYRCSYSLLNSVYYGVPQMRERMFLVAIHETCKADFQFPEPTHWCDLPNGYENTRVVALTAVRLRKASQDDPSSFEDPFYVAAPSASRKHLLRAISAKQALDDLPRLEAAALAKAGSLCMGVKRFSTALRYEASARNGFQKLMRNWPGFPPRPEGVYDQVTRFLPRDFHLFTAMKPGWQYPEILDYAEKWFEKKKLPELKRKGVRIPRLGTEAYALFKARYVPPYDPSKFPNKWRKMEANLPSRTLLAHLGKDSYSHIHFDSTQGRTISVREAARLQSFPDGFLLDGAMNSAFKQIGNAVPALMSYAIALQIRRALGLAKITDIREGTLY
jgi:DNA (cytosine-5)-methyltransferase 1